MWVVLKYREPIKPTWGRKSDGVVAPQVLRKEEAKGWDTDWEFIGEFDTMEEALAMRKLLDSA